MGYYSGKAHRKYGSGIEQTRVELTQPWEVAFEESNKGDKVRIITAQGREIEGLIEQMGSPSENYDLLLSDPKELTRSSTDVTRRDIGQTTYHHFQDISRIEFEKELIPEQDPTPIELFRQRISEGRNGVSKTLLKFLSSLIGVVVSKEESETRGDRMEVSAGTVNFKIIAEEPADEKDSSDEE